MRDQEQSKADRDKILSPWLGDKVDTGMWLRSTLA